MVRMGLGATDLAFEFSDTPLSREGVLMARMVGIWDI
jgi:hypothetical protein